MMINNYFTETGYLSINHDKEELCGDHIQILKKDANTSIVVLADGLGSGVKANILSVLTSEEIATMMVNDLSIEECVKTVAETLPICKVRGVAYSTFTIAKISNNRYVEVYNFDNPEPFLIRNGRICPLSFSLLTIDKKKIFCSKFEAQEFDSLFLLSDGIIHAGIGETMDFGWDLPAIHDYMEGLYNKDYSSKSLATFLVDHVNELYAHHPGDDASVAVIRIRPRQQVNLLVGPASNRDDDDKMLSLFFSKDGKHIVCGGTTSHIVATYLHKELQYDLDYIDKEIPPTAKIDGVDVVSEGVITLNKVLDYAHNVLSNNSQYFLWCYKQDGASQIARLLFEEATDINFYVGCAINPAHQQEGESLAFSTKMQIVEELNKSLIEMGKSIKVSYF
jgi:hypothetical protein